MNKNDKFDKKNENASESKFVFVDEGTSKDIYGDEGEQTISVGDDVFYQDLAQDVLENNVQNKIAKDSAALETGEAFDDADDDDIPEISGQFVDESDSDGSDDDVIEISVGADAYVNDFLQADSAEEEESDTEATDEVEEFETEEVDEEEKLEAEEVDEEEEFETEEVDEEEEFETEEVDEEEELEAEEVDEEEELETEAAAEEEELETEAAEDAEIGAGIYANREYSVHQAVETSFDEPEDLYSVGEAEPAEAGKVDIMGYLSDEALSEIDASFNDAAADTAQPEPLDMDATQVYAPVSVGASYGSESGYVDIDDADDYQTPSRPKTTHRKHRKKRSSFKGIAQIAALLVVVAGLTWLISRVAFSVMGSSDSGDKTSSDLLYGYSSNVSVISFDDSSDDDTSSEEEFNVGTLSVGDKNELVLNVQRALSALGYMKYADVRGTYDNTTKEAVTEFQKANSLPATGVVNSATYYALFDSNAVAPTTVTTELPTTTTAETTTTTEAETTTTEAPTTTTTTTATTTENTTITTFRPTTTKKTTTTTEKTTKKTTTTTEKTTKKTTTTTEKTTKKTTTEKTTKKTTTTTEDTTSTTTTTAKPTTSSTTEASLPEATNATKPTTTTVPETSHTTADSSSDEE